MLEEEIVPDLLDEEMQFLHALHDYSVTEAPHYTLGLPSYAAKTDNRFVISRTEDFRYAEGVHFNPTEDLFRKYRSGQIPGEFIAHKKGDFLQKTAELAGTGALGTHNGELVLNQRMIDNMNLHNGLPQ